MDIYGQRGSRYEGFGEAARRYGVPEQVLREHIGKELFWAKNPMTGVMMVCGELSEWTKIGATLKPERHPLAFLWEGPEGFWDTLACILLAPVSIVCMTCKGLYEMLRGANDPRSQAYARAYYEAEVGGGGGLFDEVSSARKADIDFLFGGR